MYTTQNSDFQREKNNNKSLVANLAANFASQSWFLLVAYYLYFTVFDTPESMPLFFLSHTPQGGGLNFPCQGLNEMINPPN